MDVVKALPQQEAVNRLLAVAEGRREYAKNAPEGMARCLEIEAQAFQNAASIVAGDLMHLYGLMPSWRWTDEMDADLRARTRT